MSSLVKPDNTLLSSTVGKDTVSKDDNSLQNCLNFVSWNDGLMVGGTDKLRERNSLKSGIKFYALTGSSDADVQKFRDKTDVTFPFWKTDPTALKTMIRANPGLVLLKKGTITGKWNWREFN